jgi:hypothetical protein
MDWSRLRRDPVDFGEGRRGEEEHSTTESYYSLGPSRENDQFFPGTSRGG